MAAAIPLRADYDANRLSQLAKHSDDADQTRRLLALAVICDGGSRGEAEGPNGLLNRKAPGRVPSLSEVRRRELAEVIERGPDPAVDGVVRWRLVDLMRWIYAGYGIALSKQTLSRIVRSMSQAVGPATASCAGS